MGEKAPKPKEPDKDKAERKNLCLKCGYPVRPDTRQCPRCGLPQCDD